MSYSPKKWLEKYSPPYHSVWKDFEKWHKIPWKELLNKDPKEIRDLIDSYLEQINDQKTTNSLEFYKTVLRSYFLFNDIILPKSHITQLRGKKPRIIPKLTPDILREIILKGKSRDSSFLIFKFQSLQDNDRMLWINRNAWSQIKPQLDEGGWTDRNGNLWKNVIRIDIPIERKRNSDPYFCFIGADAIVSLKKHLSIQGEPKDLIWEGLGSTTSQILVLLRLARRLGLISRNSGKRGVRYGYNLHEMRDVAYSLWHESGADQMVCKFCMGHVVDSLGYDKVYKLSVDYAVKEFKKAEPYLNLISRSRTTIESDKRVQELEERLKKLESVFAEKIFVKEEV